MTSVLSTAVALLAALIRLWQPGGAMALVAENLALRHQLQILNRHRRRAPPLRTIDRLLLALTSLVMNAHRIPKVAVAVRPSTILRWHRALVKRKYRALFANTSKAKPGPKGPAAELKAAIVAIKQRNPGFGCPRIARIVTRTFGVEIDKDVVRRVLARDYRPDPRRRGPSSLTFLGHSKDSLWSVDLFRCESAALRSYWVMVVLDQCTRRIVGFGINPSPVDGRMVAGCSTRPRPVSLCRANEHRS